MQIRGTVLSNMDELLLNMSKLPFLQTLELVSVDFSVDFLSVVVAQYPSPQPTYPRIRCIKISNIAPSATGNLCLQIGTMIHSICPNLQRIVGSFTSPVGCGTSAIGKLLSLVGARLMDFSFHAFDMSLRKYASNSLCLSL